MKPFISYIIICVVGIAILIRCLPRGTKKRKRFEIFAEIGIGLFISVIVLGLTSFDNFMFKRADITYLQYIFIIFFIAGTFLIASSFVSLKRIGKPTSGLEDTTRMIHKGIFKILRHPLYVGLSLITIGFLFAYQAIALIIIGIVTVILFYIASGVEDRYNIEKFGSEYIEYMKKVPMWNFFLGIFRNRKMRY
ncbi:MAG: isoprenylcysteine carboxylmethyltransferase family protein [Actinomycetia bacterium]|nr:isoprenylcysteine carboxylmethyltransferase family protein [Actinomycetes bacterium]